MNGPRIARAWETLRREGLRSFWFKLVDVLGYRRLFLLSCLRLPVSPARGPPSQFGPYPIRRRVVCRRYPLPIGGCLGEKGLQAALRPPRPQSGL
jgi:hypothetical protein